MANITDIIMKAATAASGKADIPANIKNQVLGGLSESVFGSLTQTIGMAGGIDQVKSLLSGKASVEKSPVTALAGKLFTNNVLGKLNLSGTQSSALSALIPIVMSSLSGILKDQDGDGDVDFQDIMLTLKGGGAQSKGTGILGAATSILGGLFKK